MKIDFHYHLADKPGHADELVREMDSAGVEVTLLMGGPADAFWNIKIVGLHPMKKY